MLRARRSAPSARSPAARRPTARSPATSVPRPAPGALPQAPRTPQPCAQPQAPLGPAPAARRPTLGAWGSRNPVLCRGPLGGSWKSLLANCCWSKTETGGWRWERTAAGGGLPPIQGGPRKGPSSWKERGRRSMCRPLPLGARARLSPQNANRRSARGRRKGSERAKDRCERSRPVAGRGQR